LSKPRFFVALQQIRSRIFGFFAWRTTLDRDTTLRQQQQRHNW